MKFLRRLWLSPESHVDFGLPDGNTELQEMYRLRHRRYVERGYIAPVPAELDIDDHDRQGQCRYVAAVRAGQMVGSARLIITDPLPTESYCFRFAEPAPISRVPRHRRGEVSRLVSESRGTVPEHQIVIGLMACLHDVAVDECIVAGYLYVKEPLGKVLGTLGIPIHPIEGARLVYDGSYMHNYFADRSDPVRPFFYFRDEVGQGLERVIRHARNAWERVEMVPGTTPSGA
jgi:N-acyl-L-homoserine lactone synthetase